MRWSMLEGLARSEHPQRGQAMSLNDFKAWLGGLVAEARRRQGWTQAQLAEAVGWPRAKANTSRIEGGWKPVRLARASAFEAALGLPPGFLRNALVNWREHGGDPRHFAPYLAGPEDALATVAAESYLQRVARTWEVAVAREVPALWPKLVDTCPW